jgi:hypothetical protein
MALDRQGWNCGLFALGGYIQFTTGRGFCPGRVDMLLLGRDREG